VGGTRVDLDRIRAARRVVTVDLNFYRSWVRGSAM
jgi:hypothetical protein